MTEQKEQQTTLNDVLKELQQLRAATIVSRKNYLTFDEACDYLGVKKTTLWTLSKRDHEITYYQPSSKVYFDREDLDRYIRSVEIKGADRIQALAAQYTYRNPIKAEKR